MVYKLAITVLIQIRLSDSHYLLSHVGALPLHVPVIEVPSPPHVKAALPDKAKPSIHVKVQLLL